MITLNQSSNDQPTEKEYHSACVIAATKMKSISKALYRRERAARWGVHLIMRAFGIALDDFARAISLSVEKAETQDRSAPADTESWSKI